jgi:alpha-tubulin suppressor-like RCC1 family protein
MCGITTGNALLCWGDGASGQIGDQATVDRLAPTVVAGGPAWIAAGIGSLHSCGVTQEGNAQCWGGNVEGQLGDGSLAPSSAPRGVSGLPRPMSAIVGGEGHSCGIATDGAAFCWGANDHGQLGNGSQIPRTTADAVVDGHPFSALAAGEDHVCGVSTDGRIFCWGENDRGQLGVGTDDDQSRPVRVEG